MAQADSVPSSSRLLITGESAIQSTKLRAVKLPAVRVQPVDRRCFIGGSDARVTMRSDHVPLLTPWREERGDEPEDLLKCHCYGASVGPAPVGSNIEALFFANAAFFLGRLLRIIVLILLRFVSRNKRLRNGALHKASSNQLVPSRPQERLR
jgi:hypothetical protein